jgi:hypothetical protein
MNLVRTLGRTLMAVFAMSAIAASAANAVVFEPNSTAVKAESKNAKFTAPNKLAVECKSTVASAETGISSASLPYTSVIGYSECIAFGVAAKVTETCGNEKESKKDTAKALSTFEVEFDISTGCIIVVKTSTCSMTAEGLQTLIGTWTNGNGTTTNSKFELNKAPVKVTSTGGICGASGTGTESGTFTVSPVTVKIK